MSTTIGGVRIVDMPDLGAFTDSSSVVGEHAGSGRFSAVALRSYAGGGGNVGRNLLHNPLFQVGQRGGGPWTAAASYTADRWQLNLSLDTNSVTRNVATDALRAAVGDEAMQYFISDTFTGSGGAGAYSFISQAIEGVRRLAGKTVTVSFYAVGSASQRIGVNLLQSYGSGGSPSAQTWATGASVTLSTAWSRYNVTIAVPSAAGKTLGTDNNDGTLLALWLSSGAANNAVAGGIGVQSGTIQLWGMQLEIGSAATPLEKPDPRYDLGNCQRFYQAGNGQLYYTAGAAGAVLAVPLALATMRASPTILLGISGNTNGTSVLLAATSLSQLSLSCSAVAAGTVNVTVNYTASADL